jgi:hypothetical protein
MKYLIFVIYLIPSLLFSQGIRFHVNYDEGSIEKTFLLEKNMLFNTSGTIKEIYIFSSNSIAQKYLTTLDQSIKPKKKYNIGKTTLFLDSIVSISYYTYDTPSGSNGQIKSINNTTFTYNTDNSFYKNAGVVGEISKIGGIEIRYYTDAGYARGKIKSLGNKIFKYEAWSSWGEKAGMVGEITSIGIIKINYYDTDYDIGFKGKLKSIGSIQLIYFDDKYENRKANIVGKFKQQYGNDSRLIIN